MAKAVNTDVENIGYFNPPNVYKPAILSIDIVGEYNPNDGAFNTYRITQNDGRIYDIRVKNGSGGSTGRGIADIDETPSTESSGINIIRITYTDGTHEDFQVRNGAKGEQGEQGIQGPAGIDSVTAEALDDGYSADGPEVVVGPVVDGVLPMTFKHLQGPQGEPAVAVTKYVTVEADSETTAATDVLPDEGQSDTVYRVANWDGAQYDDTAYSEYGWYSNAYVLLAVRTPGIDSVPTADSDNLVKSGGVAAGLSQLGQETVKINPGTNLFNPNDPDVLIGKYIDYNGNIGTSASYNASGYIPVTAGETYYIAKESVNPLRYACFYDSGGNVVASNVNEQRSFTVPVNAVSVRVSFYASDYAVAQIAKTESNYAEYNPAGGYLTDIKKTLEDIGQYFDTERIFFEAKSYIPTTGYSIGDTVSLTPSSNNSLSYSIVPVSTGDKVVLTGVGSSSIMVFMMLDSDNKLVYIPKKQTFDNLELTIPSGVSKLVINSHTNVASATITRAENIDMRIAEEAEEKKGIEIVSGLLNPNDEDVALGKYLNTADGSLISGDYDTTGYLPVKPGHTYNSKLIANGNNATARFVLFYLNDVNKSYTKEYLSNVTSFTAPPDAALARISYDNAIGALSAISVSESAIAAPYGDYAILKQSSIVNDDKAVVPKKYVDDKIIAVNDILAGKKIYACGDSYTHGDYTGESDLNAHKFQDGAYAGQNKVWPFFIGQRTGAIVTNLAVNGGRMTTTPGWESTQPDACFSYQLYQQVLADADYIIIKYGINDEYGITHGSISLGTIDSTDINTFYGAWNAVLSWYIANRPKAKIGIIVSNDIASSSVIDAVIAIAKKYGIKYLNEATDENFPYFYRQFLRTGVASSVRNARNDYYKMNATNNHPNDACQEFESTFVESWIKSL